MNTEIIDEAKSDLANSLAWWEKRRLWYNLFVGGTGLVALFLFAPVFGAVDMILLVLYGMVANLFYSLGFLLEAFDSYYFKGKLGVAKIRMVLLILGVLFGCFITFVGCLGFYFHMID
jgi:hypothetical protein